jgi:hypothetical protein
VGRKEETSRFSPDRERTKQSHGEETKSEMKTAKMGEKKRNE